MSEPTTFRKKPVTIQAMQMVGSNADMHAVYQWVDKNTLGSFDMNELWMDPENFKWPESGVSIDARDGRMVIATLEGGHWVDVGDWIIRGVAGRDHNVTDVGGYNVASVRGGTIEDDAERERQAIRNAAFIAAAPELVADLTAEVETLRARLSNGPCLQRHGNDPYTPIEGMFLRQWERTETERDQLRATLDRVRKLAEDTGEFQARAKHLHVGSARLLGMEILRALDGEAQP